MECIIFHIDLIAMIWKATIKQERARREEEGSE